MAPPYLKTGANRLLISVVWEVVYVGEAHISMRYDKRYVVALLCQFLFFFPTLRLSCLSLKAAAEVRKRLRGPSHEVLKR